MCASSPGPDPAGRRIVVVLTHNEERNIADLIQSLPATWRCGVVDSGSQDRTVDVARELGALVYVNPWRGIAAQRNFAISKLSNQFDWILFVDADERYSHAALTAISKRLEFDDQPDFYYINSWLFMYGRRLDYAPGYPIWHPRLIQPSRVKFEPVWGTYGERVSTGASAEYLDIPYDHFFFEGGISSFFEKHSKRAKDFVCSGGGDVLSVARTRRQRISDAIPTGLPRSLLRFLYHYILRLGFLDGRRGLLYSLSYFIFELMIISYRLELTIKRKADCRATNTHGGEIR